MTHTKDESSQEQLRLAVQRESEKFQESYLWLEKTMPPSFFEDISRENLLLVTHSLVGFHHQDFFSTINLKSAAITLCLDSPDADLRILQFYTQYGIKNYQVYVSSSPPPSPGVVQANLRIAIIYFTEAVETQEPTQELPAQEELKALLRQRNDAFTDEEFESLIQSINMRFLRSLSKERLILALDMFFRAMTRDNCQYEVRYDENWAEKGTASMQIILAWRNTPKYRFLYRLAKVIYRHKLVMKRVNATYVKPYGSKNILMMVLDLHGNNGQAAWDVADIVDFLRELFTVKYFSSFDSIDQQLVSKNIIRGNMGNMLRSAIDFIHQILVHIDPNIYTPKSIEDTFCYHPELTVTLCSAFDMKFNPFYHDVEQYRIIRNKFLQDVSKLDTGQVENDERRKNIFRTAINFVEYTLKTNFYRHNYTALSFRLDPKYLDEVPFDRTKKFPELPYAIFFIKGMSSFGFHIRFKDLSRGGLRTVYPEQSEHSINERNNVFHECYHLAYTQHFKNKDIPEGGAKGIIFLYPYERIEGELEILKQELETASIPTEEIQKKQEIARKELKLEYLHEIQRSYIENFLTIINCDSTGKIRAKYIVDYWKKPEYIYLGPDEYMHDEMITWIADFSKKHGYKPGGAFISGKPVTGINHKEYGVTSLGLHVYVSELLKDIGINPQTDIFTVKMSGGPDGDVAGNEILNLYKHQPKTAKLIALTDITGTIYEPLGLDLEILTILFKQARGIRYYPPQKLTPGGFLLDRWSKKFSTPLAQQTLCWRNQEGNLVEEWLSGSEMNTLIRNNVHQIKADIFIPAGGRPRTLNEWNIKDFSISSGKPTSYLIVEGANLYLTPAARESLEKLGVKIIKDSSANKAGVICSSFEVLCGLTLTDEEFIQYKEQLVKEILFRLKECAFNEVNLLLRSNKETGEPLTVLSDQISRRINHFTYQLLDYLETTSLPKDPHHPLIKCFLNYCLPLLRTRFRERLLQEIPESHKKAIISCYVSSHLVYKKGLKWFPSIVDVLPIVLGEIISE